MPERGEKRREKTAGSCRLAVRCLAVGLSLLMLMPTVLPLHAQAEDPKSEISEALAGLRINGKGTPAPDASSTPEQTESAGEKSEANKEKPEK